MTGRSRGRNFNNRFHYSNPRNEHDDRSSRPSTSRGGGGYPDRHGFNKKVTFKANNRGGNNFRKSWDNKTDLVRDQLDNSEYYSRNGQSSRNNSGRRSYPERNYGRGGHGNFRNPPWALKECGTGWYSVFVPNVDDCDEVLKIIQTYITPIVFYPYNKQYFDNALRFLIDDFKIAKTLQNTSYKITLRDDRKLVIKVVPYSPPRGPISFTPVSNEVKEKMIEAMAIRYNPSTKSLDLSRFYACPLFTDNQMFVPLNRPAVLLAALNMVAQHTKHDLYGLSLENNHMYLGEGLIWIRRLFPELKVLDLAGNKFSDLKELKCLTGFTIEVLNLSRNPVCDTEDNERYRRDVQLLFPMLNKLDDLELPSRYSAIVGTKLKMPINLGNSYPIPEGHNPEQINPVTTLVESFLTQYFSLYDNTVSRRMVSEAYHENATFSLSSSLLSNVAKGSLSQYMPECRNFLKHEKPRSGRARFLHRGRENIVNFLEKLPKTKHDLGSFIVDVPLANPAMVQIVINGVFAEDFKETNIRHVFRSFCRAFSIVPVGSGWSIVSDMLFVTIVNDELLLESSKRFYVFKPKPVTSKKYNNANNSASVSMFMEDNDEMLGMESSSSNMASTPNYPPPPYQQNSFPSYQPSSMLQQQPQQPPPPYQNSSNTSAMLNQPTNNFQQQSQQTSFQQPSQQTSFQQPSQQTSFQQQNHSVVAPPTLVNFQPNPQQSNMTFPMFNSTSSGSASVSANQPPKEMLNSNNNANSNPDTKLGMIKSFSNESGMNDEWAKKCLEENNWDYAKAALCFSKLKPNIPPAAFIRP